MDKRISLGTGPSLDARKDSSDTWIRVARAAEMLGKSEDTVRRMAAAGLLASTHDPKAIDAVARGPGRRPTLLISLKSVNEALARQLLASVGFAPAVSGDAKRVAELEAEVARLRAELAKAREVARLALAREEHLDKAAEERIKADAVLREQLRSYLVPDFLND